MNNKISLRLCCCFLVTLIWAISAHQAIASSTCKGLLLRIDVGASEMNGVDIVYKNYVDDIQDEFKSDFDCKLDFEKKLDSDEVGIDFFKLGRAFYHQRLSELSLFDMKQYNYVVGFNITDYEHLYLIVYDVAKKNITTRSRTIKNYLENGGSIKKSRFLYLIDKLPPGTVSVHP